MIAISVLIVDDDPAFRELADRLLRASDLDVAGHADSVGAALSAAKSLEPDAALVDIELPDGDGITLATQLSALPWRPRSLLTSIDGEAASDEEVRRSGARAFIAKAELPNSPLARLLSPE